MLLGLGLLGTWSAWVFMLIIGALFGLDVVNSSVSFVDALPLGFGFVLVGIVPLVGLFAAVIADAPKGPTPE